MRLSNAIVYEKNMKKKIQNGSKSNQKKWKKQFMCAIMNIYS
jgi:hypothetical protein